MFIHVHILLAFTCSKQIQKAYYLYFPSTIMKLFLDTANTEQVAEIASWGILDGVTTNPTLVAKTGLSFNEIIDEIFKLVDGPISLEVVSEDAEGFCIAIDKFRVVGIICMQQRGQGVEQLQIGPGLNRQP